ncbi:2-C-methyl-D-erythritol 4-phosphate cytidylyltransferase [Yersinia intermedia]|jgi:2-C-methyl-D-erythritol 4-phosphate cytidylyltransferase|uniref:2-C-methyl-D-erythritol 4-phosphate cytidylyltransferase n=1 Tax=Yersinia intermedia TaxID=631 RepID=UPI0005E16C41|nr:2-C-methyl-D-erythritol 4-phosphate cytidylyltransferase [Yersinia intermedia]MCB5321965.1 2-C-methyl-D-erythritol 4-phosphate cytidylyltransferase [Yersinia intermedia]UZM70352.1 2-C-methyl-D-erythritol 4-phosphate cytidylyltransferase [Yersinia intermedia]WET14773.1 2-C-methyl-D-erythritol 4-phosphate cytidylyltransferase [Yersinia intermedia]CNC07366.1 2-C-methyl-D-erythritol 4-phosphate cytidylyltransferase [Yersinia intermedia]CQJ55054.1 2-C-methyl-D-erythritol 4-phosphate cytidylyltra
MSNFAVSLPDVIAVLPAAGIGSRMQTDCPKQYLTVAGKTIIEHAIFSLLCHPRVQRIIVVIHPQDTQFSTLPIAQDPRITLVHGGEQRADSVMAGLQCAGLAEWVLVHDAARPCLHFDDLERLLSIIGHSHVGGILAAPVRDTMKRSEAVVQIGAHPAIAHTVDRQALWHALTPQLFPLELLKICLSRALREGAVVTDEASALEHCGYHPILVSGRSDNIKVTRPEDLALAEFYLTQRQ